jgi:hypothetical protein
MGNHRLAQMAFLVDDSGRPVGMKEADGDEIYFPTFTDDLTGLRLPSGAVAAVGGSSLAMQATAAEALPARSLVYIKSDGTVAKADAIAEGKEAIGFVAVLTGSGATAAVKLTGNVLSGLAGLTPGATYYLSTTPGALATAAQAGAYAAGNVVMPVGRALSATDLLFQPSIPITL